MPLDYTICRVNELMKRDITLATNYIEPIRTQLTISQCLLVCGCSPLKGLLSYHWIKFSRSRLINAVNDRNWNKRLKEVQLKECSMKYNPNFCCYQKIKGNHLWFISKTSTNVKRNLCGGQIKFLCLACFNGVLVFCWRKGCSWFISDVISPMDLLLMSRNINNP